MKTQFIKVIFVSLFVSYSFCQAQAVFYISPTGNDNNIGTESNPFLTLERARDTIRSMNSNMTGNIFVYLRNGRFERQTAFLLDTLDNGTNGFKIIYKAYPNEIPRISGGKVISGWTLHEKGIYKAIAGTQKFRQIYVNRKKGVRARQPNLSGEIQNGPYGFYTWNTSAKTINVTNTVALGSGNWTNLKEVELVIQRIWASANLRIDTIVSTGWNAWNITPREPERTTLFNITWDKTFNNMFCFIENAYELIDAVGEWYHNSSTGDLFYYPRIGENMSSAEVIVPVCEILVKIEGGLDNRVKNIEFEGIVFEHGTWVLPSNDGLVGRQAGTIYPVDTLAYIPPSFYVRNADSICFKRNVFQHLGGSGLGLHSGINDCGIEGNVFMDIAGNGISVFMPPATLPPAETRTIPKRNRIANNYYTRIAQEYWFCDAVNARYVDSLIIEHNEMHNLPYTGIGVGWGWSANPSPSKDNKIRFNNIHHVLQLLCDGGGIYVMSRQPGNHIFENYIHHITRTAWGNGYPTNIFQLDEGSAGMTYEHNVYTDVVLSSDVKLWGGGAGQTSACTYINNATQDQPVIDSAGIQPDYIDIKNWNDTIPSDTTITDIDKLNINAIDSGAEIICRPNPFNPVIRIFILSGQKTENRGQKVQLRIYNVNGKAVTNLSSVLCSPTTGISWDASDKPSGLYFAHIKIGDKTFNKKLVLMK